MLFAATRTDVEYVVSLTSSAGSNRPLSRAAADATLTGSFPNRQGRFAHACSVLSIDICMLSPVVMASPGQENSMDDADALERQRANEVLESMMDDISDGGDQDDGDEDNPGSSRLLVAANEDDVLANSDDIWADADDDEYDPDYDDAEDDAEFDDEE